MSTKNLAKMLSRPCSQSPPRLMASTSKIDGHSIVHDDERDVDTGLEFDEELEK